MTRKAKREKDALDEILDQFDFHGMTQEEVLGPDGVLKALSKRILERSLEAEMEHHLGYEKNSPEGDNTGNSCNGHTGKTVIVDNRTIPIEVPRDRNGTFEPVIVPKYQKRTPLFNDQIISLYARGMSVREIQAHLGEIYGVDVSPELISRVTDAVVEEATAWRSRPLESSYPVVFLDALRVNSRQDGRNVNKSLYIALGVGWDGRKDVLGMWLVDSEGARFWAGVLTELRNRGVDDILVACVDGLGGFPDAVRSVFPDTRIQLCIVHMVRSTTRFVSRTDLHRLCAALRKVYTAPSEGSAMDALDDFEAGWGGKYPRIAPAWRSRWDDLKEFFSYPPELRKVIYTTNSIESLNHQLRKVTKSRSSFPTDDAVYKIMYLAVRNVTKSWKWRMPDWERSIRQFEILFPGRVPQGL